MNKDIKIKNDNYNFKYRVCSILIVDDKLLTVQIMNNGFYCLPGGHVKQKERSYDAIKREIKEELNFINYDNIMVKESPCIVNETIFKRKDGIVVQEISFIYKAMIKNADKFLTKDKTIIEIEDGKEKQLEFKWIPLKELRKSNFKPQNIIDKIISSSDETISFFVD